MKKPKTPIRNCEECQHFRHSNYSGSAFCAKGQMLRFTFPKLPGLTPTNAWGWRRSCKLFEKNRCARSKSLTMVYKIERSEKRSTGVKPSKHHENSTEDTDQKDHATQDAADQKGCRS